MKRQKTQNISKTTINQGRLKYLLDLYSIGYNDLLNDINDGLTRKYNLEDLQQSDIKVSILRKIDNKFKKGLSFYTDPTDLPPKNESSIFFRKTNFKNNLSFEDKRLVTEFEDYQLLLSTYCKLTNLELPRIFKTYNLNDDPKLVANECFKQLKLTHKENNPKEQIKQLFDKLSEINVIALESIPHHALRDKISIEGFFIQPNFIVIKKQKNLGRELFTLAHEFGHYLLDIEEVERIEELYSNKSINFIEKWCNEFAYHLIVHNYDNFLQLELENIVSNNYDELVSEISYKTNISKTALYTRLYNLKRIDYSEYKSKVEFYLYNFQKALEREEEQRKREIELKILSGKNTTILPALPIHSPLEKLTFQKAFFEGLISEYEVCKYLRITKPEKFEKVMYESYN